MAGRRSIRNEDGEYLGVETVYDDDAPEYYPEEDD